MNCSRPLLMVALVGVAACHEAPISSTITPGAESTGGSGPSGGATGGQSGTGGGSTDAGVVDAGEVDAGPIDAGLVDAGSPTVIGFDALWDVVGHDATGNYIGQVEVKAGTKGEFTFVRVIHYSGVVVERDRELWWVWEGRATRTGSNASISVSLKKADFVRSRGALVRTEADKQPTTVVGAMTATATGWSGTFSGPSITASETWSNPQPHGAPIFAGVDRTIVPSEDALSDSSKAALFLTFKSFQDLPAVQPWVSNPDFQAAVHGYIVDKTDFDFYQSHKQALRLVDKVNDAISLEETLARANAYRHTFAEKAACFDADTPDMIDPVTGSVGYRSGTQWNPSGDSALWMGHYVAANAYRFWVTGAPDAKPRAYKTLDGLVRLVEITGDSSQFARVLRPATGNPTGEWHAGTGANAGIEWREGGNNDMLKGLWYGYLTGYMLFCTSGSDPICKRIEHALASIIDHVAIATDGTNGLISNWIAYYVIGDTSYGLEAQKLWLTYSQPIKLGNGVIYQPAYHTERSGTNLQILEYLLMSILESKRSLISDTSSEVEAGYRAGWRQLERQRMAQWDLFLGHFGASATSARTAAENARWRLRELPCPKPSYNLDQTISPEWVMSPFPEVPWKLDWTTEDRVQGLRGAPLFESPTSYSVWKNNPLDFRDNLTNSRYPGIDYLHAYWLARYWKLVSATE